MNWRVWVLGIVHAVVSGAVNAALAAQVDPAHFNFSPDGLRALAQMAAGGAVLGVLLYLKRSPLPSGWDGTESRDGEGVTK